MEVVRLKTQAILPTRATSGSAGYDLTAIRDDVIEPGCRQLLPIGISIKLPEGVYGRIAPRSGLAVKKGIQVGAGVIDPDYTGEIHVLLFNHGTEPFEIHPGDRIAQLILEKFGFYEVLQVDSITETLRGSGGFGSTGV
jgi:dUTP pyrophosphatase